MPPLTAPDPPAFALPAAIDRAAALAAGGTRVLLGLAGAPGAGKSTCAARIVAALGPARAVLVPMDGFHLAGDELRRLGRAQRKGAADTFDAAGYVALLRRLAEPTGEIVYAPEFRREIEEPVAGAIAVAPDVPLVVTEGNYLLLDTPPWDAVAPLLAEAWYVDVDEALRVARLVARHERYGRSPAEARERAHGSDAVNARLVATTRGRATAVLTP